MNDKPKIAAKPFRVVAIAASAGGIAALDTLFSVLPADFPCCVLVVQHLDPHHRSLLAQILQRHARLSVHEAVHGQKLKQGNVFVAPPDRHLLVEEDGRLALVRSEMVHFVRPSADLLFESLAAWGRGRVIGVVLTGSGSDGAAGLKAIKEAGGTTVAQDPETCEVGSMPRSAINTGCVDFVLPLDKIPTKLIELAAKVVE